MTRYCLPGRHIHVGPLDGTYVGSGLVLVDLVYRNDTEGQVAYMGALTAEEAIAGLADLGLAALAELTKTQSDSYPQREHTGRIAMVLAGLRTAYLASDEQGVADFCAALSVCVMHGWVAGSGTEYAVSEVDPVEMAKAIAGWMHRLAVNEDLSWEDLVAKWRGYATAIAYAASKASA